MRKQIKLVAPDVGLLVVVAMLLTVGVMLVFSASAAKMGDAKWARFDVWYMVKRQLIWAVAGLGAMFLVSRMRFQTFLKWTTPLLLLSVVLLIAVLLPGVGNRVNGATRWIKAGPANIQPSELAKVAVVLYLAGILSQRKMLIRRIHSYWFVPLALIGVISLLVFIEPDMGTAMAIICAALVMLFAAGARISHLIAMLLGGGIAGCAAIMLEPYRLQRIWVWINPWKDPYGDGYQVIHGLFALGTGGICGFGLCEGREKLYIPAASTDYILATVGEELGLIGCLLLLAAFVFFVYRGLDIARRSKSTYGNLVAVGVTAVIGMQAAINIAVVSAAIPATGVPLPFISYGGSSLVSMLVATGILLSVSRQINVELEGRELYENSLDGRGDGRSHISGDKRRSGSSRSKSRRKSSFRR